MTIAGCKLNHWPRGHECGRGAWTLRRDRRYLTLETRHGYPLLISYVNLATNRSLFIGRWCPDA